jgi:hypothetical protein
MGISTPSDGGGGGGGGTASFTGGTGIDPSTIIDGDTLTAAFEDAADLDASGAFTGSTGTASFSGGTGIDPSSITDGDTITAAFGDANDLDSAGNFTGSTAKATFTGGTGIDPSSITDGDTVSAAFEDANGLDASGNLTGSADNAPKDANYVVGSSDPDLTNETVVSPASDILTQGDFGSTTKLTPGFDSFVTVSNSAPALVAVSARAETDGTSRARIFLRIDESGGTSFTYELRICRSSPGDGAGNASASAATTIIPAGATIEVTNISDPNNGNDLLDARALVLST